MRPEYHRFRGNPSPLEMFRRLYGADRHGFLYESLESRGTQGRYSFLGGRPGTVFRSRGDTVEIEDGSRLARSIDNPIHALRALVRTGRDALPVATFPGGAVGFAGYDWVRFMAPVPDENPDELELPDAVFLFPKEFLIIDHLDEVVHFMRYDGSPRDGRPARVAATIRECERVAEAAQEPPGELPDYPADLCSNTTRKSFESSVSAAQEYIRAGDIFQVVLSQRFEFPLQVPALSLFAALRRTNPSPYMYYLKLDDLEVAGSSPEVLVKLTGRRVVTRPLAGTRPRGATPEEDERLAAELLADDKERAEHVMLVDLARNDIGRHCRPGSICLEDYLQVERYSKVMHLVSNVTGRLRDDRDAFDLFTGAFPAGTVSGAPKVRAMQIIDELEPSRRGPYAGAIGYFSYLGDMDLCIGIRTVVCHGGRGYLQAGAGIVADSVPAREYDETVNKARAVLRAAALAERSQPVG